MNRSFLPQGTQASRLGMGHQMGDQVGGEHEGSALSSTLTWPVITWALPELLTLHVPSWGLC